MAQLDSMKVIDSFIFHSLSKAGCVQFVRCIPTLVDQLKVHFRQDLTKTHLFHLVYLRSMHANSYCHQHLEKKLAANVVSVNLLTSVEKITLKLGSHLLKKIISIKVL